jgi:ribosome maturation factor RimP
VKIKTKSKPLDAVLPGLEQLAARLEGSLIDLEMVREPHGRVLRITISREGGVTLDYCERFHRLALPLVDSIDYDYLEVSSPGADRPLKTEADWSNAIGSEIEFRFYKTIEHLGKRTVGRLVRVSQEAIEFEASQGLITLARRFIADARLAVRLDDDP